MRLKRVKTKKAKEKKRDYAIDLIRSVAIVLIISFHVIFSFNQDNSLRYIGFFGVSLFFIVSGFMLAKKYSGLESFSLPWFFKRFFKIASLYYLAILSITFLFSHQSYSGSLWKNIGLHLLFIDPLFPKYAYGIISPAWFLTPLIALYLIYPYLNKFVKKYNILVIIFFLIMIYFRIKRPVLVDYNPLFFIGEFCFGISLAYGKKLLPLIAAFLLVFVDWITIIPFFLFFLMYKLPITDNIGKLITLLSLNTFALFLFHEAYMNLIIGKWQIYSLALYPALIVLSLFCFISVLISNKLQKAVLSKI